MVLGKCTPEPEVLVREMGMEREVFVGLRSGRTAGFAAEQGCSRTGEETAAAAVISVPIVFVHFPSLLVFPVLPLPAS